MPKFNELCKVCDHEYQHHFVNIKRTVSGCDWIGQNRLCKCKEFVPSNSFAERARPLADHQ